jgi:tRNA-splicing ligase RtcB
VGYDINCGVRLAGTGLVAKDLKGREDALADALFSNLPSGVGSTGFVRLKQKELKKVLEKGAAWAVENSMGTREDVERTEENGCMAAADATALSDRALERGLEQLGTLGSGNHFVEVGLVDEIFDEDAAKVFGLFPEQVTVMLHSGSRGLGYQVCDDNLAIMRKNAPKLDFALPDRQLSCAYLNSPQGRQYFAAMACAANYAWANRQILLHQVRETFLKALSMSPRDLAMHQIYDVCHNIAKMEKHTVNAKERLLCVHRKGATRAFGPGRTEVPSPYRAVGQPVLVPGDMGRESWVLKGTAAAMEMTFGSTCHGAGRLLSRTAAKKASQGRAIHRELAAKGITVRAAGRATLHEEIPEAYKNVAAVVNVVHNAGLSTKVARIRPLVVVKG